MRCNKITANWPPEQIRLVFCVWPFSNSSTTLVSVCYHSCLLGCTVDHSDNRFLQRGPFHFSSLEWMDCRLRRETQGHFSSKCHCTRKSLVMSTFLYSIVCLCGCCGAPRSSHIPPNQTIGVVLKQLKTSCFSSQSLEQWWHQNPYHSVSHSIVSDNIWYVNLIIPRNHDCLKLILVCFR